MSQCIAETACHGVAMLQMPAITVAAKAVPIQFKTKKSNDVFKKLN
jgi:hypothetical protein